MSDRIPAVPGSYLLWLRATTAAEIELGARGRRQVTHGDYLYLGSAHGPGGLAARLRHHLGQSSRPHWHLDYLRAVATPIALSYSTAPGRLECLWATGLMAHPGLSLPFPGFGASDCRCHSHLFFARRRLSPRSLSPYLRRELQTPVRLRHLEISP